jgi:hypothetical protein
MFLPSQQHRTFGVLGVGAVRLHCFANLGSSADELIILSHKFVHRGFGYVSLEDADANRLFRKL